MIVSLLFCHAPIDEVMILTLIFLALAASSDGIFIPGFRLMTSAIFMNSANICSVLSLDLGNSTCVFDESFGHELKTSREM